MSARVVNPFSLNEMRRLREAVVARPMSFRPDSEARARVCRNLWGKASADDSRAFATKEMTEMRERAAERWGFDFLREMPLSRSHGAGAERYKWVRVRSVGTVPAAYKMPRMALDRVLETARATVPSVPVARDAPAQQHHHQEASATADAASPITAPIVAMSMASPDSCSAPTSATESTVGPSAPTRQSAITDYLQCRKRSRSAKHDNPSKRRKSESASRL